MSGTATSSLATATLRVPALSLSLSLRSVMKMFWGWDVLLSRISGTVSWVLGHARPLAGEGIS